MIVSPVASLYVSDRNGGSFPHGPSGAIASIYIYMPPLHVFPLPEGSLNALPRVLRAPETDQPHLRANASIAAPTPFNGMGGRVA